MQNNFHALFVYIRLLPLNISSSSDQYIPLKLVLKLKSLNSGRTVRQYLYWPIGRENKKLFLQFPLLFFWKYKGVPFD